MSLRHGVPMMLTELCTRRPLRRVVLDRNAYRPK
jgi:hypothetical protein